MLSLGLFRLVVESPDLIPEMHLVLGRLRGLDLKELLDKMAIYTRAYYLLAKLSDTLSKFWIPSKITFRPDPKSPEKTVEASKSVFIPADGYRYDYMIGKVHELVNAWSDRGVDWLNAFRNESARKTIESSPELFRHLRDAWLDPTKAKEVSSILKELREPVVVTTQSKLAGIVFMRFRSVSTDFSVAQRILFQQQRVLRSTDAVPRGVKVVSSANLEDEALDNGLQRPMFKEGNSAFWALQPAAGRMKQDRREIAAGEPDPGQEYHDLFE